MVEYGLANLLGFFRAISQILSAGIAITAFSLLLFAFSFNLKDRLVRTFALILLCVMVVFTGESIGSAAKTLDQAQFWLRFQWMGIILLVPAYLHFSDSLLALTGKPSRWRRVWAVRFAYVVSAGFILLLLAGVFVGPPVIDPGPAPYLQPTLFTIFFVIYYVVTMLMSWYNFWRALRRTRTATSRRRTAYLIVGALGPAVGSFPFLLFSSGLAARTPLVFWIVAAFANLLLGALVVVMAYAVSFFGVAWSDRLIRARLLKWLLRGPVTALLTLGITTLLRRTGVTLAVDLSVLIPIIMVMNILVMEHFISLLYPWLESRLFFGRDRADLELLRRFQERLLTRNDLRQFIEMVLATVTDRVQAAGAYVAAVNGDGLEMVVTTGKVSADMLGEPEQILERATGGGDVYFQWSEDIIFPLLGTHLDGRQILLGILGISGTADRDFDEEELDDLGVLARRASSALRDRKIQREAFSSLQTLEPEMDYMQQLRMQARYDGANLLQVAPSPETQDVSHWVKEALTHYWGGPKLTENPLLKFHVIQESLEEYDGNTSNALRGLLRKAIDQTKPEGERRFTADWILYNILEMKFLEGRKVREVASRLALSEADLYRKQRIAIDAVAKTILELESSARNGNDSEKLSLN